MKTCPMIMRVSTRLVEIENNAVYQILLLLSITLIAAVLRLYKLGEWSFWGDEIITVRRAQDTLTYGLGRGSISQVLTHAALSLFGTSEWTARLAPALIGVVSVPILYFPIRKLFGPVVALVSGLVLAVSPWHLYWSQNARFYSSLLLLYSLALLTFYFGVEEDRPRYMILSLILLGLATQERLIALFFVPVVACYLFLLQVLPFEKPGGLRLRTLAVFLLPALIFGLFFAFPYIQEPSRWWITFGRINNNPFWILSGVVYYTRIPTICMGVVGILYLLSKKHRAALLLGLGAWVPLLAIMAVSPFHYAANRYVFVSLTSWVILASSAVVELVSRTQKETKFLAMGALIFLLLDPVGEDILYYKYQHGNRDNAKAAFEFISQRKQAGELVVAASPELGEYYLQDATIGMEGVDLAGIRQHRGRVWFVEDMNVEERFPDVHNWILQHAQLAANLDVHAHARNFKMRVYLYDPVNRDANVVSRSSVGPLR